MPGSSTEVDEEPARRRWNVSRTEFASAKLYRSFEQHVRAAQDAFLHGDNTRAEHEATMALRIRPTAHLFALLAVIAESKAQFDRASDFRLLQAFMARDSVLWEELLHDFLAQELYYKSVVCLQRLSALEVRDGRRYRALQLQLADLLIGLGEIRRATSVLVPLWNSSRCRDFEVFALLASLYFQLGRWASLQRLIESSLQYAFRVTLHNTGGGGDVAAGEEEEAEKRRDVRTGELVADKAAAESKESEAQQTEADDGGEALPHAKREEEAEHTQSATQEKATQEHGRGKRVSKRVRFFGMEDDAEEEGEEEDEGTHGRDRQAEEKEQAAQKHVSIAQSLLAAERPAGSSSSLDAALQSDETDEFDFDELDTQTQTQTHMQQQAAAEDGIGASQQPSHASNHTMDEAQVTIHNMYGDAIALHTPQAKRNFLTLVNVHAELLNEEGKMLETIRLLEYAAAALQVSLLELPPDLLVRLGIAYAFLGRHETQCREVFQQLLETCAMDEYGDVLLDAANSLLKVGMYRDAKEIYHRIGRYHQFHAERVAEQIAEQQKAIENEKNKAAVAAQGKHAESENDDEEEEKAAQLRALREEYAALKVVLAAAYTGEAQCHYALRKDTNNDEEEEEEANEEGRENDEGEERGGDAANTTIELLLRQALAVDPTHLQARLLLGKLLYYDKADLSAAVEVLTPRSGEPALQRIELGNALVHVFRRAAHYVEAIALGVSIFELILSSAEDGDTQSVAPGSTRRNSAAQLSLPTMARASSALVPVQSLVAQATFAAGPGSAFARTSASLMPAGTNRSGGGNMKGSAMGGLASSMAASIYAGSGLFRQQLGRQGRTATLTSTVYGASAAASIAAGWTNADEEEARSKDSSAIFAFHYKRRNGRKGKAGQRRAATLHDAGTASQGRGGGKEKGRGNEHARRRKRRRREGEADEDAKTDVAHMQPRQFWEGSGGSSNASAESDEQEDDAEQSTAKKKEGKTSAQKRQRSAAAAAAVVVVEEEAEDNAEADLQALESALVDHDHDKEEGEEKEKEKEEEGEGATYALPSLEEVSRQFDDPAMATLFLQVSSANPLQKESNEGGARASAVQAWDVASNARDVNKDNNNNNDNNEDKAADPLADRVTVRDVLAVLGRRELIDLAVTIVDCYSALHKFTEAKEFAFLTLTRVAQKRLSRQLGNTLERPLRLAVLRAALAAGESEDAYRVGIRLLQENSSERDRCEVIELLHGVLHRAEDRSAILYRLFMEGECDVPLLVLLANRYHQTRSFTRVLNLYLLALQERPQDIFLNFMVGLSYYLCSHQKRTRQREACVSAGTVYLTRYQSLLIAADSRRTGEAVYNTARALHFLHLYYLCIPLYERVARELRVPEECSPAVQRAAQLNLYFIYRWGAENRDLALAMLPAA